MKLLLGLFLLFFCFSLLGARAQSVTIQAGPQEVVPFDTPSYWVWSNEYQCWIWVGPRFHGDYEGHDYGYWHHRHSGDSRDFRPGGRERHREHEHHDDDDEGH